MKQIIEYLKLRRKILLLFLVCTGIFALVFYLSRAPLDAVLYAGLLCLTVLAAVGGYEYYHFQKKYKALKRLTEIIDVHIDELPEPSGCVEQAYTELIRELYSQKREAESKARLEKKDLADYFSMWTHQIKTPIAAMSLILQQKGAEAGEDDKDLVKELFQIEEYVDCVMSYIRIQDISADLQFDRVPLDRVIRKAVKKYAGIFIRKKIRLDFQDTGSTAVTDEKWILFVLGQILSNALKYTPQEGTIHIYMEDDRLMIRDTGIGIPAQDLPLVFHKGFTGQNGRRFAKSTGQGLYLCKVVMDRLSHGIRITSAEGEGTTVILDFYRETFQ